MKKLTIESAKSRLERKRNRTLTTQIESQNKTIEFLQADNKSISDAAPQLKNMIETFIANIPSMQAEAAKAAIYALFESGNCHQHENGAGDGYIESGDALKFADKYAEQILKPSEVTGKCSELAVQQVDYIRHLESEMAALAAQVEAVVNAFTDATNTPEMQAVGKILKEAFGGAPQQHLAEVKVQAGRDGFIAGYMLCNDGSPLIKHNYEGFADRYADSIRQGEVK